MTLGLEIWKRFIIQFTYEGMKRFGIYYKEMQMKKSFNEYKMNVYFIKLYEFSSWMHSSTYKYTRY